MGIAQLITGVSSIILRWDHVKLYWPHMVLILLVFVLHIQDWWATYELRTLSTWRLQTFLFITIYPVNLYFLARILFPVRWSGNDIDLKQFYFDNFRKIYVFVMILPIHSILDNYFIGGYGLENQIIQFLLLAILSIIVFVNRKDEWIHKSLAVLFLLICVITFVVAWNSFLISE